MKKTTIIIAVILAFTDCGHSTFNKTEVRHNALGYMQALGDYDIDSAIPFCTRQTQEKTLPTLRYLTERTDTAFINSNRPAVFTIGDIIQIDDSTARVYYHKSTPINEIDDSLTLRYEDGQWLADVHLAFIPFINNIQKGPRSISEFPRDMVVPHKATSIPREMVDPMRAQANPE